MTTSKIQIVETSICPDTFDDSQLPTDVHIVTYTKDGVKQFDAVRATLWLISLTNTTIS